MKSRLIAMGLTAAMGLGTLVPAAMAANEKAAHNAAIGATAVSAYLLLHKRTRTAGVVGAAGSAYLWKKHHDAVKERHERERRAAYYRTHRVRYYTRTRTTPRRTAYRTRTTTRRYYRTTTTRR